MLVFDKAFLGGVLYDEPSQLIPGYQVAVIRNIGCEMLALQDQNKTALWLCLCSVTLTESMLIFYLPTCWVERYGENRRYMLCSCMLPCSNVNVVFIISCPIQLYHIACKLYVTYQNFALQVVH